VPGRQVARVLSARVEQSIIEEWRQRFLHDLAVVRSANTVRAYGADLQLWIAHCRQLGLHPFRARPRTVINFIRRERELCYRAEKTVTPRTVVRRLCAPASAPAACH